MSGNPKISGKAKQNTANSNLRNLTPQALNENVMGDATPTPDRNTTTQRLPDNFGQKRSVVPTIQRQSSLTLSIQEVWAAGGFTDLNTGAGTSRTRAQPTIQTEQASPTRRRLLTVDVVPEQYADRPVLSFRDEQRVDHWYEEHLSSKARSSGSNERFATPQGLPEGSESQYTSLGQTTEIEMGEPQYVFGCGDESD